MSAERETDAALIRRLLDEGSGDGLLLVSEDDVRRLDALAETLGRVRDAREHYQAVQRRGHSPYIRENGRQGGSPWAELMDAIDAALAGGTEGR